MNRPAQVRQTDAARIFKAAQAAGFTRTRLVVHPDGRIEYIVEKIDVAQLGSHEPNDFDEVLKK